MKNQPPPRASVLVVVMEAGARWPSWTGELRTSAPDVVIIAQQRDDDAGAFESRVARRVTALGRIETAVIAMGDGKADLALRSRIARRLLSAMTGRPHGQLLLAAAENATAAARHDIP